MAKRVLIKAGMAPVPTHNKEEWMSMVIKELTELGHTNIKMNTLNHYYLQAYPPKLAVRTYIRNDL